MGVIDYSLYLSEASLPGPEIDQTENDSGTSELSVTIDQNRFLEEHNSHLKQTLDETKSKLQVSLP